MNWKAKARADQIILDNQQSVNMKLTVNIIEKILDLAPISHMKYLRICLFVWGDGLHKDLIECLVIFSISMKEATEL